jgi:hypothetical protein
MNAGAATIAERYAYLLDDEFADVPRERERPCLAVDSPAAVERNESALDAASVAARCAGRDAGHNVQRDAPRAVVDAIAAFAKESES